MRTQTLHANEVPLAGDWPGWATRLFRGILNRFLLLPLGAAIALVWANVEPEPYFRFSQALAFPVNAIGMAFFLALIAQDLFEAMMPGGALRSWRHWLIPAVGALGAVVGAAAGFQLFISMAHEAVLAPAWPVATAIDIAAGYYILRLIYPAHHLVLSFLLLIAVLTDAIAISVATAAMPGFELHPAGALLLLAALFGAALLRRYKVRAFWPYWLGCGSLSWFALYWMGLHPALALVPIVPLLPHDARRGEVFADRLDRDPTHFAEHEWNAVAQVALFLFGLVNAGVIFGHADTGTWAVMVAAVAGRPLGILVAIGLAVAAGLRLPRTIHWTDLVVMALATTSGFTFALFLAAMVLPAGAVAQQITVGALATTSGALLTLAAAWLFGAGRFQTRW